jgi:hypothetical protein
LNEGADVNFTLSAERNNNQIIYLITINFLHVFSAEQFNFAASQAKGKNMTHMQSLMNRAIEQKAKSASLFEALAQLQENPSDTSKPFLKRFFVT